MKNPKKYFYMRNGSAQGPVQASVLRDLSANGLIEGGMICEEGSEEWVSFSQEFPEKKKVEPVAVEENFVSVLRRESAYNVARGMVRVTAAFMCIGVVVSWISLVINGQLFGWAAIGSGGMAVLLVLAAIGAAQLLEAVLDGADAIVRMAAE